MSEGRRPDPDHPPAGVSSPEGRRRGRLKIFLGAAAGVGKTYTMLQAAHQRREEGVDVVVALAETHDRPETEALLAGLEVLRRRRLLYRGLWLTEMDLDAILARRPALALVDELAHSNAEGSRHPRRWQDVAELLESGVDVYTTLNVQHLESLNDVVAQITGVRVRETVPDSLFEQADEVELVDLPPEELIARLHEGKVYVAESPAQAVQKFFRPGNLIALRELALRRTAQRVDREMRAYMATHGIAGPWPAGERVLVCLSPGATAERLLRTGWRLAASLDAELHALFVETLPLPAAQQEGVSHTLRRVEEMGGRAATVTGLDVAEEIVHYARSHNVTRIVIGKPLRSLWREALHRSLLDRVLRGCPGVDLHVISTGEQQPAAPAARATGAPPYPGLLKALGLVALVTLLGRTLFSGVDPTNLVMFYLLVVVISGLSWGRGPAVLSAVAGVLAFDFFLIPPFLSLTVSDVQFLITFAALLAVALALGSLTGRVREQAALARRRETETAALFAFSRTMVGARQVDEIAAAAVKHLGESFGQEVLVLLPEQGQLHIAASTGRFKLDAKELAAAAWSFEHGQPAGRGTHTLPGVQGLYLPLQTARTVIGVLALRGSGDTLLSAEQRGLLAAFTAQVAVAMERAQLYEEARQVQLLSEADKLRQAILNSISHDLRTPLASIIGSLTTVTVEGKQLDDPTRRDLIDTAREEAQRLNELVGNLLDISRLESGTLKLASDWYDLRDAVAMALERKAAGLKGHPVRTSLPEDLPLLQMDYVLIVQVLINLLENAAKYSPHGGEIEVRARDTGETVEVAVLDRGQGVPQQDWERVFEKFYHVGGKGAGTGLGLAICRGIIELHRGSIWLRPREGGGTVVTFRLPRGAAEAGEDDGRHS